MRKRTLTQTWVLGLRMWREISKRWAKEGLSIHWLKRVWLEENGFEGMYCNCFFCDYSNNLGGCGRSCPGKLVNSSFNCTNKKYNYEDRPVAFYKELLRLNRIRKGKK